ncbi:SMI1/KNR4 family protein [Flavobacterium sp. FlaQc-48]|uniref:SMI1/KNR4 family protein n=1 Tax=Flavobacterium sp. FlaQc-48 TaxID=3374181 RepID=UPI003757ACBB
MTLKNLQNIWRAPKYLPYLQPQLTNEILENAESQIGFKLPHELVEILKFQNGGYLRYKLPESPHEIINGIGPYFPSLINFDWEESKEYVSFELDGLIPLDGDGHWYICLDYRENKKSPKISFIDIECDHQDVIANSFKEYLELLELDVENELVIETKNSIEELARQLENILEITFEEPNYFNSGYANYRSAYKEKWLWLTPNKVPQGFVREDDKRYDELKDQMDIFSLQYPEINENALFLELSEESLNDELVKKLREHDIKVTLLTEIMGQKSALTEQLTQWHNADKHTKIIQALEALPEADLNYELTNLLGRAYNNNSDYDKAITALLSQDEKGAEDPLWNFRMGYAYYHKFEKDNALPYFQKSVLLGDATAVNYLKWCEDDQKPSAIQTKSTRTLDNVAWVFSSKFYHDTEEFNQEVIEYQKRIYKTDELWKPNEIVSEVSELQIQYTAWIIKPTDLLENETLTDDDKNIFEEYPDEKEHQVEILAILKADNGKNFTALEFLLKTHQQQVNKELGDHVFFEGTDENLKIINGLPTYYILCGS